jgi:hypothetical protein
MQGGATRASDLMPFSFVEGESLLALPVEGATRAPVIARLRRQNG